MKRILITQRLVENELYPEIRQALDICYCQLLSDAGLLPILVPYNSNFQEFLSLVPADGFILSGGNDLSVVMDNELNKLRDELEGQILTYAMKKRIPVLGICRGLQYITHFFGGKVAAVDGHRAKDHQILIEKNTRFGSLISDITLVNSFHNYAPSDLGRELILTARSKEDGVIEAIEHRTLPVFGIQWHPERFSPLRAVEINLLRNFFEAS